MNFSLRTSVFITQFFLMLLFAPLFAQSTGVDVISSARRDLLAGENDAALAALDAGEKRGLTNGKLTELRGYILLEQGKFSEAIKAFETAKTQDKTVPGRLHIGDVWARQNKWQEARDSYYAGLKETDILSINERLRFGVFISYLGLKNEEAARQALDAITFPTQSAAYYYAQAAWAFAHGSKREGDEWLKRARDLFGGKSTDWFERHLYDFGWLKNKPAPISE